MPQSLRPHRCLVRHVPSPRQNGERVRVRSKPQRTCQPQIL
ncbi:hypothetical protein RHECNPAF_4310092 [Rhizobium etli CNPAF512]|nr:hypothetical protein RHECNPAF_4310092 [Rhizobium etli CNPAF512]